MGFVGLDFQLWKYVILYDSRVEISVQIFLIEVWKHVYLTDDKLSADFLIYCYMGFCIFHIRKSYYFLDIEYAILMSHIDIWEQIFLHEIWNLYMSHIEICVQIFTHHIWNFSHFLCGNLRPDSLENIWNSLYFPSKNKMNFWDEKWIFAHFSYENQGTYFLTWHMNSVYFRLKIWVQNVLHDIWNFPFQMWKSYLR